MDALILSCSTGGGHNAAGRAIKEELEYRGHHADMLDPYTLVGNNLDHTVGNAYVTLVQHAPWAFGFLYQLGEWYRRLPVHSPVYLANKLMMEPLLNYLQTHHYDVIFLPHLFPGEMLTYLRELGVPLPKIIFIATDYTCIPFTEEIYFDYCIAPSEKLIGDFIEKGISPSKIVPLGIPVRREFRRTLSRREAVRELNLDPDKHYFLLSGGSIGAGKIYHAVRRLKKYLLKYPNHQLIVICGGNQGLYDRLQHFCGDFSQIMLIRSTNQMAAYMQASDLFICKPGGLSSTEAAVLGVPLIHISPIPGCESRNFQFFNESGMSVAVGNNLNRLFSALDQVQQEAPHIREAQRRCINPSAAADICDLAENMLEQPDIQHTAESVSLSSHVTEYCPQGLCP